MERGFINVDQRTGSDLHAEHLQKHFALYRHLYGLSTHGGLADLNFYPSKSFCLAEKRQGILKLGYQDVCNNASNLCEQGGASIEIVSKVILRHANLSMTQRYLGKVSDDEASRWDDTFFSR